MANRCFSSGKCMILKINKAVSLSSACTYFVLLIMRKKLTLLNMIENSSILGNYCLCE